jgi:hypothetical protein
MYTAALLLGSKSGRSQRSVVKPYTQAHGMDYTHGNDDLAGSWKLPRETRQPATAVGIPNECRIVCSQSILHSYSIILSVSPCSIAATTEIMKKTPFSSRRKIEYRPLDNDSDLSLELVPQATLGGFRRVWLTTILPVAMAAAIISGVACFFWGRHLMKQEIESDWLCITPARQWTLQVLTYRQLPQDVLRARCTIRESMLRLHPI